jgi:hypothetical protein
MDGSAQRKRPGVVFAGFAAVCGVLLVVVFLPKIAPEFSLAVGRGGWPYLSTAIGAAVLGGLLMALHPDRGWKSFGKGMVFGGVFGVVAAFGLVVLFLLTWHG